MLCKYEIFDPVFGAKNARTDLASKSVDDGVRRWLRACLRDGTERRNEQCFPGQYPDFDYKTIPFLEEMNFDEKACLEGGWQHQSIEWRQTVV